MVKIEIVNKSNNALPKYETDGSVGLDVRAFITDENIGSDIISIQPGDRKLIPTGLYTAIPIGYEIQVRPRSGLAFKQGLSILNSPGTIDSDYRNDIGIILHNTGKFPYIVKNGDRIAQLVLSRKPQLEWVEVDVLDETERTGGFGHTGVE